MSAARQTRAPFRVVDPDTRILINRVTENNPTIPLIYHGAKEGPKRGQQGISMTLFPSILSDSFALLDRDRA
jgi:hypothetical protein